MELARIRKYRRKHELSGLLLKNPALTVSLNLPFFIATSISLRAAAVISLELAVIHMGTMCAALVTCRFFSGWSKPLANAAVSTVIMIFARLMLINMFRGITDVLGMYIYLMAVNGMTMAGAGAVTKKDRPLPVLAKALISTASFSAVMYLVCLFREYFGSGSVWGYAVPAPVKLSGVGITFFGFIIMGFTLAGARLAYKLITALLLRESMRRDAQFTLIGKR